MSTETPAATRASGFTYALTAYLAWGAFPVYWKQLAHVPAVALVAHRVVWSFFFVLALMLFSRRMPELLRAVRSGRTMSRLLLSTSLISVNWLLFIWAVNNGHVIQGSLGYYINPLINVLLGRLMLGERLRRWQMVAVGLAFLGVLNLTLGVGQVPWISLVLAGTFALYGLVRKLAPVEALTGLAVETGLALPLALAFFGVQVVGHGQPLLGTTSLDMVLLLGSGAATALPLLWFTLGARRLPYSTLGILQYVAPSCQLALAVLVYGEEFTSRHALTFGLIWAAVLLYTFDALRGRPAVLPAAPARQGT